MKFVLLVFHIIITLVLIGIILIQRGEDANAGGGGNPTGMFSARGAKNLLTRVTAILASIFFLNCLVLAVLVKKESHFDDNKKSSQSTESLSEPSKMPLPAGANRSDETKSSVQMPIEKGPITPLPAQK